MFNNAGNFNIAAVFNLGQVSMMFNKDVEISDFFNETEKVFDSYRLASAAFDAQLAQMLDPVDAPGAGFVLCVVSDSVPPGTLPFEAVQEDVKRAWKIDMACAQMRPRARTIYDLVTILEDGTMFIGVPIDDAQIMRDVEVQKLGLIGESIIDPLAANAICDASSYGLMGPFRGDAGWYVVNVKNLMNATREDFDLYSKLHGDELMIDQREAHWKNFIEELRSSATIVDNRSTYFRY